MDNKCAKLSPLISLKEGQVLAEYLHELYPIYQSKIAGGSFTFHGKPIHVFTELNYNLQQQSFEHLTTKGSNDRLYNLARCERIVWIKDILSNLCADCDDYRLFPDTTWKSGKAKRYIIWCVKEDYVIILEERQKNVLLITAYCVIYPHKRSFLESEYKKSLK